MNERLTVEIDAKVDGLKKKMSEAGKLVERYEDRISRVDKAIKGNSNAARKLSRDMTRLNNSLKKGNISQAQYDNQSEDLRKTMQGLDNDTVQYQRELKRLSGELMKAKSAQSSFKNTAKSTTGQVGKLGKTTRTNAVPAMTSFSQVIQDAPYGIQGVANNIQQLTMQMGYLSANAGGAKGAVKALVGSLLGPAGILLAVSALTSVLVSYGDEIMDFIKNTSDAEKMQRKLTEAMASGIAEARTSSIEISALAGEIKKHSGSLLRQKKAYDKLNDVAPDLTEIYTQQEIAAGKADDAIKALSESLLQQAKIDGAKKVISELNEEIFKLQNTLGADTASTWDWLDAIQEGNSTLNILKGNFKDFGGVDQEFLEMAGAKTGRENIKELQEELERSVDSYKEMLGLSTQATQDKDFFNISSKDAKEAAKAQQEILDELAKGAKGNDPVRIPITPIIDANSLQRGFEDATTGESFKGTLEFKAKLDADLSLLKEAQSLFTPLDQEFKNIQKQIEFTEQRLNGFGQSLIESGKTGAEGLKRIGDGLTAFTESQKISLQEQQAEVTETLATNAAALSSALGTSMNYLTDSLAEGKFAFEDFAKIVIKSLANVATQLLQQAIVEKIISKGIIGTERAKASAKGVTIATNAAAALGPAGIGALPVLLSGVQAMIQGAFSGAQTFATGGMVGGGSYTGDNIIARLNSGEGVLTSAGVDNAGSMMNASESVGAVQVNVVGKIQGDDLILVQDRAERRKGRIG